MQENTQLINNRADDWMNANMEDNVPKTYFTLATMRWPWMWRKMAWWEKMESALMCAWRWRMARRTLRRQTWETFLMIITGNAIYIDASNLHTPHSHKNRLHQHFELNSQFIANATEYYLFLTPFGHFIHFVQNFHIKWLRTCV